MRRSEREKSLPMREITVRGETFCCDAGSVLGPEIVIAEILAAKEEALR